jgi:hypothetical protein
MNRMNLRFTTYAYLQSKSHGTFEGTVQVKGRIWGPKASSRADACFFGGKLRPRTESWNDLKCVGFTAIFVVFFGQCHHTIYHCEVTTLVFWMIWLLYKDHQHSLDWELEAISFNKGQYCRMCQDQSLLPDLTFLSLLQASLLPPPTWSYWGSQPWWRCQSAVPSSSMILYNVTCQWNTNPFSKSLSKLLVNSSVLANKQYKHHSNIVKHHSKICSLIETLLYNVSSRTLLESWKSTTAAWKIRC